MTPSGKILSFGTTSNAIQNGALEYAVWTPSSGTGANAFQLLPNVTNTDTFCAGQVIIPSTGEILIAGGDDGAGAFTNFANNSLTLFEDATDTMFDSGTPMAAARWYPTTTTLPNGEILVQGGGAEFAGPGVTTPEIYNRNTGWRSLVGASSSFVYSHAQKRWWYPRAFVAPDGRVFGFTGGVMYYLDPAGNGSLQTFSPLFTGSNIGATSTAVMFEEGRILQVGGGTFDNTGGTGAPLGSVDATIVDINGGAPVTSSGGQLTFGRHWLNSTLLPSGEVVITGGSQANNSLGLLGPAKQPEIWNPSTGQFTLMATAEQQARLYHSVAMLMLDGRVLVAGGGVPGPETNLNAQIYSPPYLFNGGSLAPRPVINSAPSTVGYGTSFDITFTSGNPITDVVLMKTGSVTHSFNFEQRRIPLSFSINGNTITADLPNGANYATPGQYMVFLIDNAGTPSVATLTRLFGNGTGNAPTADAGGNQTVSDGSLVTLDGTGSTDDGTITDYQWTQLTGTTTVTLSDATAPTPTFTAPAPSGSSENYTFELEVTDDESLTDTDTTTVTISSGTTNLSLSSQTTIASNGQFDLRTFDAWSLPWVDQNAMGALDIEYFGANGNYTTATYPDFTYDDGQVQGGTQTENAHYRFPNPSIDVSLPAGSGTVVLWVATGNSPGSVVNLSLAGQSISVPYQGWSRIAVAYSLSSGNIMDVDIVNGGGNNNSGVFAVAVDQSGGGGNQPPVANAGADQSVTEGNLVTLNGSGSTDDQGITGYSWSQTGGSETITLSDASAASPTFTAPTPSGSVEDYTFELTVTDGEGAQDTDTTIVTVSAQGASNSLSLASQQSFGTNAAFDLRGSERWSMPWVDQNALGNSDITYTGAFGNYTTASYADFTYDDGQTNGGTQTQNAHYRFNNPTAQISLPAGNGTVTLWLGTGSNPGSQVQISVAGQNLTVPYQNWSQIQLSYSLVSAATMTIDVVNGGGNTNSGIFAIAQDNGGGSGGNQPPIASAGANQNATEGNLVTLDGSGSSDDVGITNFAWVQTGGSETITLSDASAQQPTFTAPTPSTNPEDYTFQLTVTDGSGAQDTDTTTVSVSEPGSSNSLNLASQMGFSANATFDLRSKESWSMAWVDQNSSGATDISYSGAFGDYTTATYADFIYDDGQNFAGTQTQNAHYRFSNPSVSVDLAAGSGNVELWLGTGGNAGTSVEISVAGQTVTVPYQNWSHIVVSYSLINAATMEIDVTNGGGNTNAGVFAIAVDLGGPGGGNQPPVANAGQNQNATEGNLVTLDGTGSTDDVGVVSYAWTQTAGTATVSLSDPSAAQPTFTAPTPSGSPEDYVFQLLVTDGESATDTDSVTISVSESSGANSLNLASQQTISTNAQFDLRSTNVWSMPWVDQNARGNSEIAYSGAPGNYTTAGYADFTYDDGQNFGGTQTQNAHYRFTNPSVDVSLASGTGTVHLWLGTGGNAGTTVSVNVAGQSLNVPYTNWSYIQLSYTISNASTMEIDVVNGGGNTNAGMFAIAVTEGGSGGNQPPNAIAGTNQSVNEGDLVQLDGSASTDDTGISSYLWTQTGGTPTVSLSNPNVASPTFTAPTPPGSSTNYTFELLVTDPQGAQDTDTTVVTVSASGGSGSFSLDTQEVFGGNAAFDLRTSEAWLMPWVDQNAQGAADISITGAPGDYTTANYPDFTYDDGQNFGGTQTQNAHFRFNNPSAAIDLSTGNGTVTIWVATGANAGTVANISLAGQNLTVPYQNRNRIVLTYSLTGPATMSVDLVNGGGNTNTGFYAIAVDEGGTGGGGGNQPPIANAGPNQGVTESDLVTLDATGSSDDNGITTYAWTQTGGSNTITLSDPAAAQPTFTAPAPSGSPENYTFQVTVTDAEGESDSDTVTISVSASGGGSSFSLSSQQVFGTNAPFDMRTQTAWSMVYVDQNAQGAADISYIGGPGNYGTGTFADFTYDDGQNLSGTQTQNVRYKFNNPSATIDLPAGTGTVSLWLATGSNAGSVANVTLAGQNLSVPYQNWTHIELTYSLTTAATMSLDIVNGGGNTNAGIFAIAYTTP